jgi:hypothetical protein
MNWLFCQQGFSGPGANHGTTASALEGKRELNENEKVFDRIAAAQREEGSAASPQAA